MVRHFHLPIDCRIVFPSFSVLTVASKMHDLRDEYSSRYFGQANQSVITYAQNIEGKMNRNETKRKLENEQLNYKLKEPRQLFINHSEKQVELS